MKSRAVLWMALATAVSLFAGCNGGKPNGELDGVWEYAETDVSGEENERYSLDEKITISGGAYEWFTDYVTGWGPWSGGLEKGKFRQTKTEITFLPEARANYAGEEAKPLSAEEQKSARRTFLYSLSEEGLRVDDRVFRRPYTGAGMVYGGTLVRGKSRQNMRLSIGGYENGEAPEASYTYWRRTPVKLKGRLTGSVLELAGESGDLLVFPDFSPRSDTADGYWLTGGQAYEVTLDRESLEGIWQFERQSRAGYEFMDITITPEHTYEAISGTDIDMAAIYIVGERGTVAVTDTELTFKPTATAPGRRVPPEDEDYEELDAEEQAEMQEKLKYVLFGNSLTLESTVFTKRRPAAE